MTESQNDMSRSVVISPTKVIYSQSFKVFEGIVRMNLLEKGKGVGKSIKVCGESESDLIVGNYYQVIGTMAYNEKYKTWQIEAESITPSEIMDNKGMVAYILNECKFIGKVKAEKIVAEYPEGCKIHQEILDNPDRVRSILSERESESVIKWAGEQSETHESKKLLYSAGATKLQVEKIVSHFGSATAKVVSEDCFRIMEVRGLGFSIADSLSLIHI